MLRQSTHPVTIQMHPRFAKIIHFLYGPYFKVAGFFYRIYTANRARVTRLKANQTFAAILRGLTVLMLVGRLELYTVLAIFMPAFWRK